MSKKYIQFLGLLLLSACTYLGEHKIDNAISIEFKSIDERAQRIEVGDRILINMIHTINDSIIKNTYLGQAIEIIVTQPAFEGDLMSAFLHLHLGDSAFIKLDKEIYFKNSKIEMPKFLENVQTLDYLIKIEGITKAKVLHESSKKQHQELIKKEINFIKNHLDKLEIEYYSTKSLIFYSVVKRNKNGTVIQKGDTVIAHCKGSLIGGKIFDNTFDQNTPYEFIHGQSPLIFGLQEAISLMKEGERLKFFIPSYLGYGSTKIEMENMYIPSNSPLEYEIEILKVKTK